jgi:outer membrane protein assembly factor BamB
MLEPHHCSEDRMLMFAILAGLGLQPAEEAKPVPRTPRVLWKVPLKSTSFGGGAVADINRDGAADIAFCTYFNDSKIYMLNGKDGSVIWTYDASSEPGKGDACLDGSCKFADVDRDGKLELIAPVSNRSEVLCLDATTGTRKWVYEAGYGECIDTPPWIGPFADHTHIVVGSFKSRLHVINGKDGRPVRRVQVAPKGAVQTCPIVMDVNGDGALDYIAGTFNGDDRLVAVDGKGHDDSSAIGPDGKPLPPGVHELWHVQTKGSIYHGPSIGDFDHDGKPDFVFASYDGNVYAVKADGTPLWTASPGERYIMSPTAVVDLDGDLKPYIIVAGEKITALKADGSTLWSKRFDDPGAYWSVTRGVSVADLDGDGKPDLAAVNGRGLFKVLRGSDGETLYEFDAAKVFDKKIDMNSSAVIIADFDGDGKLDVFFVVGHTDSKDPENNCGMAICLTGFDGLSIQPDGQRAGWFMHRHDLQNTGNVRMNVDCTLLFPRPDVPKP